MSEPNNITRSQGPGVSFAKENGFLDPPTRFGNVIAVVEIDRNRYEIFLEHAMLEGDMSTLAEIVVTQRQHRAILPEIAKRGLWTSWMKLRNELTTHFVEMVTGETGIALHYKRIAHDQDGAKIGWEFVDENGETVWIRYGNLAWWATTVKDVKQLRLEVVYEKTTRDAKPYVRHDILLYAGERVVARFAAH